MSVLIRQEQYTRINKQAIIPTSESPSSDPPDIQYSPSPDVRCFPSPDIRDRCGNLTCSPLLLPDIRDSFCTPPLHALFYRTSGTPSASSTLQCTFTSRRRRGYKLTRFLKSCTTVCKSSLELNFGYVLCTSAKSMRPRAIAIAYCTLKSFFTASRFSAICFNVRNPDVTSVHARI